MMWCPRIPFFVYLEHQFNCSIYINKEKYHERNLRSNGKKSSSDHFFSHRRNRPVPCRLHIPWRITHLPLSVWVRPYDALIRSNLRSILENMSENTLCKSRPSNIPGLAGYMDKSIIEMDSESFGIISSYYSKAKSFNQNQEPKVNYVRKTRS